VGAGGCAGGNTAPNGKVEAVICLKLTDGFEIVITGTMHLYNFTVDFF